MRRAILLLALIAVMPCPADDGFVGSMRCAACHDTQYRDWQGSHHDLAMQHASEESVLGDFDNAEFSYNGVSSRFFKKGGEFFVNTDGADGSLQDFQIRYTFGVTPLQQYLVAFPDGRVQALSIAWDSRSKAAGGQRWYHLYPDEAIDYRDELHWTGPQQNWNFMCADCHSTNLKKAYSATRGSFQTTWSEINVGCEACHGPGQMHVAWSGLDEDGKSRDTGMGLAIRFNERRGISWPMQPGQGTSSRSEPNRLRTEINACARCHSRRSSIRAGAEASGIFLDHHRPVLLTEGLYHPDGQILDEVYVWGSFAQSKMYSGGVSCSDCHDPHSQRLKAGGDAVCAQCHAPEKFGSTRHHHHPAGSAGTGCLDCHMPQTTYMGVDARRDHSMRIPRPDHSLEFGTPNACNRCHTDQTTQWAAERFAGWYPDPVPPFQNWTGAFVSARAGNPEAETLLARVIADSGTPDIARATAVRELHDVLSQASLPTLRAAITDDSPLVRMASLGVLERLAPQSRYSLAGGLLEDPVWAVRIEAGRVLADVPQQPLDDAQRDTLMNAVRDYIAAQELHSDRVESQVSLGNLYVRMGDPAKAERRFRRGIDLNPKFAPAYINLSDLYRAQDLDDQAVKILGEGIAARPDEAALHHSLGLAFVRQGDSAGALTALEKAVMLAPGTARYAYVFGVALNSTGQAQAGVAVLEKAHTRHPLDRDILLALATINRDLGRMADAVTWAEKLVELNPSETGAQQLLRSLTTGN
jgi:tetratricopeptide (TPR) repeat protein